MYEKYITQKKKMWKSPFVWESWDSWSQTVSYTLYIKREARALLFPTPWLLSFKRCIYFRQHIMSTLLKWAIRTTGETLHLNVVQLIPSKAFVQPRIYLLTKILKQKNWGKGEKLCPTAPGIFLSQAAPAPRCQKHAVPCGSGSWLLDKFGKIFFPP